MAVLGLAARKVGSQDEGQSICGGRSALQPFLRSRNEDRSVHSTSTIVTQRAATGATLDGVWKQSTKWLGHRQRETCRLLLRARRRYH